LAKEKTKNKERYGRMQCPKCGTSLRDGDVFCKACGARLVEEQKTEVNIPNLMRQPNHNEQGKTKIIVHGHDGKQIDADALIPDQEIPIIKDEEEEDGSYPTFGDQINQPKTITKKEEAEIKRSTGIQITLGIVVAILLIMGIILTVLFIQKSKEAAKVPQMVEKEVLVKNYLATLEGYEFEIPEGYNFENKEKAGFTAVEDSNGTGFKTNLNRYLKVTPKDGDDETFLIIKIANQTFENASKQKSEILHRLIAKEGVSMDETITSIDEDTNTYLKFLIKYDENKEFVVISQADDEHIFTFEFFYKDEINKTKALEVVRTVSNSIHRKETPSTEAKPDPNSLIDSALFEGLENIVEEDTNTMIEDNTVNIVPVGGNDNATENTTENPVENTVENTAENTTNAVLNTVETNNTTTENSAANIDLTLIPMN
jgi:uncharacterized Zn finger protein (UPF0148 family)